MDVVILMHKLIWIYAIKVN